MHQDIQEILVSQDELAARVAQLGAQISADYRDKDPIIVSVLRGSCVFHADLLRAITIPCTVDFLAVSSYGRGVESSGRLRMDKDLSDDIAGRHVIIVEDILDTGNTLFGLLALLGTRQAASLKLCVLLDKPDRRQAAVNADYTGFVIPDAFVVGYGLDYAEHYRNLPYVGILSPSVYQ